MLARKSTIADLLKGCYCSFILLYGSAAAAIEPYEVMYIGTLGGYAVPHSINDAGDISCYSYSPAPGAHAYLWSESSGMIDLGTLGGSTSYAHDSNTSGTVVGSSVINGFH